MSKGTENFFVCCTHVVIDIIEQQCKRSAAKLGNLIKETRAKGLIFFKSFLFLFKNQSVEFLKDGGEKVGEARQTLVSIHNECLSLTHCSAFLKD